MKIFSMVKVTYRIGSLESQEQRHPHEPGVTYRIGSLENEDDLAYWQEQVTYRIGSLENMVDVADETDYSYLPHR